MSQISQLENQLQLFTIGHSNYPMEYFVELLQKHEIEVVADVRSNPYSRYATHFTGEFLKKDLINRNFKYVFLGKEIGGKPKEEEFYDDNGYVDYALLAASEKFRLGMERLERGLSMFRVAIMCGEENPSGCHRHLLIARVAHGKGIKVSHIRKCGETQDFEELLRVEQPEELATQLNLFSAQSVAAEKEKSDWRSEWQNKHEQGDSSDE